MFDNIGYNFSSMEEILIFVDWVTTTFDQPEDFEEYLKERFPALSSDGPILVMVDGCGLIDEYEETMQDTIETEASFWDIISKEYHHDDDSTILGPNRLEE